VLIGQADVVDKEFEPDRDHEQRQLPPIAVDHHQQVPEQHVECRVAADAEPEDDRPGAMPLSLGALDGALDTVEEREAEEGRDVDVVVDSM
jgi:hypothetical protein